MNNNTILAIALKALKKGGGGGGGTSNYNDLSNKPSINGNTLAGNQTAAELGIIQNEFSVENEALIISIKEE